MLKKNNFDLKNLIIFGFTFLIFISGNNVYAFIESFDDINQLRYSNCCKSNTEGDQDIKMEIESSPNCTI